MIDQAARALLALGCFVGVGSARMLLGTAEGTPERIVSIFALLIGIGIVAISTTVLWLSIRRRHRDTGMPDPDDDSIVQTKEEE